MHFDFRHDPPAPGEQARWTAAGRDREYVVLVSWWNLVNPYNFNRLAKNWEDLQTALAIVVDMERREAKAALPFIFGYSGGSPNGYAEADTWESAGRTREYKALVDFWAVWESCSREAYNPKSYMVKQIPSEWLELQKSLGYLVGHK